MCGPGSASGLRHSKGVTKMSELEENLNKVLEEHQHESGLHVIGGRRRLIDRLVQFFEEQNQSGGKNTLVRASNQ